MAVLIEKVGIVIPIIAVLLFYGLASVWELLYGRSSQDSIAWLLSLFFFPYVTVFLYLAFGWKRFDDYVRLRRRVGSKPARSKETYDAELRVIHRADESSDAWPLLVNISQLAFLGGNEVELLIDGRATYDSIFAGIRAAQDYVLLQFYIIRDDTVGRELANLLIEKARTGVTVLFLYDDIGSADLPNRYLHRLEGVGVHVSGFNRSRPMFPLLRPFRINFRNHRKIVIADGHQAWIEGLNVGAEYLGNTPHFRRWRDTYVHVKGPAALAAQISYAEDWHWATGKPLHATWPSPVPQSDGEPTLVMPSDPADTIETCAIAFTEAIGQARKRLWIVSPYFVPGEEIQTALSAAGAARNRCAASGAPASRQLGHRAGDGVLCRTDDRTRRAHLLLSRGGPASEDRARRRRPCKCRNGEFRQPLLPYQFRDHLVADGAEDDLVHSPHCWKTTSPTARN